MTLDKSCLLVSPSTEKGLGAAAIFTGRRSANTGDMGLSHIYHVTGGRCHCFTTVPRATAVREPEGTPFPCLSYPVQSGSHQRSGYWRSRTRRHCPRAGGRIRLFSLQGKEKPTRVTHGEHTHFWSLTGDRSGCTYFPHTLNMQVEGSSEGEGSKPDSMARLVRNNRLESDLLAVMPSCWDSLSRSDLQVHTD